MPRVRCIVSHIRISLTLPLSGNVRVHDGFQDAFLRSSATILSGVQNALAANNATRVLVTGHSLGGAIATMDGVMLRKRLPASISVNTVVFGLPRGGNKAWADLVDSTVCAPSSWMYSTMRGLTNSLPVGRSSDRRSFVSRTKLIPSRSFPLVSYCSSNLQARSISRLLMTTAQLLALSHALVRITRSVPRISVFSFSHL